MAVSTTTIRPYDFALREHREALFSTHLSVNRGAAVILDWLLTCRGGLRASFATAIEKPSDRQDAMRMLVRCWFVPEIPTTPPARSTWKPSIERLREVLVSDGVSSVLIDEWCSLAEPMLAAPIREDAGWIDRRALFDGKRVDWALDDVAITDILFASGIAPSLFSLKSERMTTCIQAARGWLSKRLGSGTGANFARLSSVYAQIVETAERLLGSLGDRSITADAFAELVGYSDVTVMAQALSDVGHRSRVTYLLREAGANGIDRAMLEKILQGAINARDKTAKVVPKGPTPATDRLVELIVAASGLPWRGPTRDHLSEYACMIDVAARRLSQQHSGAGAAEILRIERAAET
ncbi:MAG: hypothetical protein ACYDBH_23070, partial [Acidobacteriaceae bacterium]